MTARTVFTTVATKGPQIDSPQYLAWKRFAPGASATYIDRGIGQRMVGGPVAGGLPGIRWRCLWGILSGWCVASPPAGASPPVPHRNRVRPAPRQYGASAARHRVRVSIAD